LEQRNQGECTQKLFPVQGKKFSSALWKNRELTQTANRVNSRQKKNLTARRPGSEADFFVGFAAVMARFAISVANLVYAPHASLPEIFSFVGKSRKSS